MKRSFIYLLLPLAMLACEKNSGLSDAELLQKDSPVNENVIPVEQALATLGNFMRSTEGSMMPTKSMAPRSIASVEPYYGEQSDTKAGEDVPVAYIVNFEDEAGFAVLGATANVSDIIAVTESGSINPITLEVSLGDSTPITDIDDLDDEVNLDDLPDYSIEDDDYYTVEGDSLGNSHNRFVEDIIRGAFNGEECDWIDDGSGNGPGSGSGGGSGSGSGSGGSGGVKYTEKQPLLNYSWGQKSPHNTYCRFNWFGKTRYALTGCSSTAMAMIVAYNEYPQSLKINGSNIDWTKIKSGKTAYSLDDSGKDMVARLMGGIYNFVSKIVVPGATLITPEQIKKRMKAIGYQDVNKLQASSFTQNMLSSASTMLKYNKPVFISAIPKKVKNYKHGHSWVIDGAKYSSGGSYLLHFNFGWNGSCNGYFSLSCLNPSKGVEYDNPSGDNTGENYVYSWHFRMLTYNLPSAPVNMTIDYNY